MSYLLDTDICSAHLRFNRGVTQRFMQYGGRLHVSVVTVAELYTWACRAKAPPQRRHGVADMLADMTVIGIDEPIARRFGELQASFRDAGHPAPELDLFIGATALIHGLTLVTHNSRDYANVPGLSLDDWLVP
jgi:tRNA(fMet)-specific endonuclease VapC